MNKHDSNYADSPLKHQAGVVYLYTEADYHVSNFPGCSWMNIGLNLVRDTIPSDFIREVRQRLKELFFKAAAY